MRGLVFSANLYSEINSSAKVQQTLLHFWRSFSPVVYGQRAPQSENNLFGKPIYAVFSCTGHLEQSTNLSHRSACFSSPTL